MGTDKRARQKANRAAKQQRVAKAETVDNIKGRALTIVGVVALIGVAVFFLSRTGADDTTTAHSGGGDTPAAEVSTTTTVAPVVVSGDECPAIDGSAAATTSFSAAPPMCIDPSKVYTAEMETNLGTVTIELDASRAPQTVNNFVVLARYHYYDGATFHRVIDEFMIQGGDPVGNPAGTGNPGYVFNDELPIDGEYEIGSIAMANSGANTQGSQFFIVTGDAGVALPPLYSLFGQVTEGMDVVGTIEGTETGDKDRPLEPVIIESITITEG